MRTVECRRECLGAAALVVASLGALGQPFGCPDPQWQASMVPGANWNAYGALLWDEDGAGPAKPLLAVAGDFTTIGGVLASRVAIYDPESGAWSALGSGLNSSAFSLTTASNGDLIVGGWFMIAGGKPASRVARWSPGRGGVWSAMGPGISNAVFALATMQDGTIVAAGYTGPAAWDGSTWKSLGAVNNTVNTLLPLPDGGLLAGGIFTNIGGVNVKRLARWNGTVWSEFAGGVTGGAVPPWVDSLARLPNGELLVGGGFLACGGVPANRIARWDGAAWHPLGSGLSPTGSAYVDEIAVLASGQIVVGGAFTTAGGNPANNIARWDGAEWHALGSGAGDWVYSVVELPNGDVAATGFFGTMGGLATAHVARYGCGVACYADCDSSGVLDIDDFVCFQTLFSIGEPGADCDGDVALTIDDFVCFQTAFAAGC